MAPSWGTFKAKILRELNWFGIYGFTLSTKPIFFSLFTKASLTWLQDFMILKQTEMRSKLHQETGLLLSINTPNIIQGVDGRWQPAVDAKNAILHSSTQANGAWKSCSLHHLQLKITCTAWPLSVQPRLGSQRPPCNIATWQIVKTIWYGKQFWKWYLQRCPFPLERLNNPNRNEHL